VLRGTKPVSSYGENLVAGMITGVGVQALTNPIWVVKTRMAITARPKVMTPFYQEVLYHHLFDGLRKLYTKEGVAGLYRGFVPGIFGTVQGAIQIMVYDESKQFLMAYRHHQLNHSDTWEPSMLSSPPPHVSLSHLEYLALAAFSKTVASVVSYPYQVIRSRKQDYPYTYHSGVLATWREKGIRGFYRGLVVNTARVIPSACVVFFVYEKMIEYLARQAQLRERRS